MDTIKIDTVYEDYILNNGYALNNDSNLIHIEVPTDPKFRSFFLEETENIKNLVFYIYNKAPLVIGGLKLIPDLYRGINFDFKVVDTIKSSKHFKFILVKKITTSLNNNGVWCQDFSLEFKTTPLYKCLNCKYSSINTWVVCNKELLYTKRLYSEHLLSSIDDPARKCGGFEENSNDDNMQT